MVEQSVEYWKEKIKTMTQMEACSLWRFAPSGHPLFVSGTELCDLFEAKYKELGGMTPAISKAIGW